VRPRRRELGRQGEARADERCRPPADRSRPERARSLERRSSHPRGREPATRLPAWVNTPGRRNALGPCTSTPGPELTHLTWATAPNLSPSDHRSQWPPGGGPRRPSPVADRGGALADRRRRGSLRHHGQRDPIEGRSQPSATTAAGHMGAPIQGQREHRRPWWAQGLSPASAPCRRDGRPMSSRLRPSAPAFLHRPSTEISQVRGLGWGQQRHDVTVTDQEGRHLPHRGRAPELGLGSILRQLRRLDEPAQRLRWPSSAPARVGGVCSPRATPCSPFHPNPFHGVPIGAPLGPSRSRRPLRAPLATHWPGAIFERLDPEIALAFLETPHPGARPLSPAGSTPRSSASWSWPTSASSAPSWPPSPTSSALSPPSSPSTPRPRSSPPVPHWPDRQPGPGPGRARPHPGSRHRRRAGRGRGRR
jgi:hypothetical protein